MDPYLRPQWLLAAYRQGAFPMAEPGTGMIYWFRPDPRAIIPLDCFHVSRSLAKTIRQGRFEIRVDTEFEAVMRSCADRDETWISEDFVQAYGALHRMGAAHSVETWLNGQLVGGTYGVSVGAAFMAESMFHTATDASKVAIAALVGRLRERDFALLDVQYMTDHLATIGAVEVSDEEYERRLQSAIRCRRSFA